MPYSPAHAPATRARIVDAARRLFNRQGFEQVSIGQIMAEAGMTRGGFYHHFADKEALFVEAVASFGGCGPFAVEIIRNPSITSDAQAMARRLVDLYLSDVVFEDADLHCPLYALPSDSVRNGHAARTAYTSLITGIMHVLRRALEPHPEADQRARAVVSLCVGAMVLARTTEDAALSRSVRASAHAQAMALLEA
ncbi:MAG: TetR/AcrR family transcriptional regulator [Asticcacaulis sp.]